MVEFKCTIKTSSRNREHKRKVFRLRVQGLAPSRPEAQWVKGRTKQWVGQDPESGSFLGLRKGAGPSIRCQKTEQARQ